MSKKVIQMYDKYKSTTKIYPKIIKECLPEDISGKIEDATKVTANPTLAGTESALTGLEVGETKYKVPTPTTVEANPELAGTEADLESIQIGDTKYKVGGGKQLYQHNIYMSDNSTFIVYFKLTNSSSEKLNTKEKVATALKDSGYTDNNIKCIVDYGRIVISGEDYIIVYLNTNSTGTLINANRRVPTGAPGVSNNSTLSPTSVTDSVQEL